MQSQDHFIVTKDILEPLSYIELVTEDMFGAVASFFGTVRSPNLGHVVEYIEYEGYDSMIQTQMAVLAKELREQFSLGHIVLAHRLGKLKPSEASIAIVISSKHRKDALAACEQGINRSKELLPVWKYEVTGQNGSWVKGSSVASKTL